MHLWAHKSIGDKNVKYINDDISAENGAISMSSRQDNTMAAPATPSQTSGQSGPSGTPNSTHSAHGQCSYFTWLLSKYIIWYMKYRFIPIY